MRRKCKRHGARHLVESGRGNGIAHQLWRGVMRGSRAEVDNGADLPRRLVLCLFHHPLCDLLRQAQRGHQVLLKQQLNGSVIHIKRLCRDHLPRGVDQNIHLIEGVDGRRYEVGNRQTLAQIACEKADVALVPRLAQFFLEFLFIHIGAHDIGTFVRKFPRDGEADAVRRTCNNRGFTRDRK